VEEVTPNEIAKILSVTGLTFRNWLRAEKAAGHPVLAGHEYRSHYRFTRQEADQLVAEYRASRGHPRAPGQSYRSDSQTGAPIAAAVPARPAVIAAGGGRTQAADPTSRPLPPVPASFGREDLEAAGFTGWTTWADLHACDFAVVPSQPGTYVVFRPSDGAPAFVHPSPAGWFKGENPSVPEGRLQAEWVEGANVLYIGKADFRNRRRTANARSPHWATTSNRLPRLAARHRLRLASRARPPGEPLRRPRARRDVASQAGRST
jgi:hypothetical protein